MVWPLAMLFAGAACHDPRSPSRSGQATPDPAGAEFSRKTPEEQAALRKSCEAGNLDACADLGYALAVGYPLAGPHADEGLALLDRACDGGAPRGCRALGAMLRLAREDEPKRRGATAARRGCEANDGACCWILYQDYARGLGVPRDESESERWLRRACELGRCDACQSLHAIDHQAHVCP